MLARQFCPLLSGLIYIQPEEWSLPLLSYDYTGLQRLCIGQLEVLKKTCDRYILAGSPSALAELFSLRSFRQDRGPNVPTALVER